MSYASLLFQKQVLNFMYASVLQAVNLDAAKESPRYTTTVTCNSLQPPCSQVSAVNNLYVLKTILYLYK